MADKEITNLPASQDVTDETLFVVYQPGEMEPAQKVSAEQLKQYTNENIAVTADNIKKALGYTPADPEKTVGVETQTFTDAQKEQARKNIGAVGFGQLPDIVCSAQGEVISLSDSSDRELKGLRIIGKTTQEGTPAPDAPVELVSVGESGRVTTKVCGRNLLDTRNSQNGNNAGLAFTNRGDGSYNRVGTATSEYPNRWLVGGYYENDTTAYITLLPGKSYFVGDCALYSGTASIKDSPVSGVITIAPEVYPNGVPITGVRMMRVTTGQSYDDIVYPRLFEGTVDYGWEPYKDGGSLTVQTPNGLPGIPVESGGNYTDETGQQWICDEVDFARGKYVQRCYTVTLTGNEEGAHKDSKSYMMVYLDGTTNPLSKDSYYGRLGLSNKLPCGTQFEIASGIKNIFAVNAANIYIAVEGLSTEAEYRDNILPGMVVQYILETPIETDLSAEELAQYAALHTNYPNTTVFNDAGAEMELKYVADTKTYIDNKFAQLAVAIVNNA